MSQVDILLDYLCKEIDDTLNESDINLIRQEYIEKGLSDELVDTAINEAFELYLGDENRV